MLKILTGNPYVMSAIIAAVFASGWTVRGWQHDSIKLAIKQTTQVMDELQQQRESKTAKVVQDKLKGLKANERTIEIRRQDIIHNNNHVYTTACVAPSGLDHINRVKVPTHTN